MRTLLAILLLTVPALAADPQVHRDLAYAEPKNERQTLDVYAPAEGKDHPVVLWIHGGGGRQGEKAGVQKKPQAFIDKGFVFVSINYRFMPQGHDQGNGRGHCEGDPLGSRPCQGVRRRSQLDLRDGPFVRGAPVPPWSARMTAT